MPRAFRRSHKPWIAPLIGAIALIGCAYATPNTTPPDYAGRGSLGDVTANRAAGYEGGILFSYPKRPRYGATPAAAANPYLWRAALLTLSGLPLASADPFGGVIITGWYSFPNSPGERFKDTVFITSRELRSDAVHVSVFRQVYQGGRWIDVAVGPEVPAALQAKVLDEARRLQAAG